MRLKILMYNHAGKYLKLSIIKNLFVISLAFLLTGKIWAQPDPDFSEKRALQERQKFIQKSSFVENQSYADYDLVYQRMHWQIDPGVKYIRGSVMSYFKSNLQQLSVVEFDLRAGMVVDSVLQRHNKISFLHINNKLTLQAGLIAMNEIDSVEVFYHGEPEPEISGFGSFSVGNHAGVPALWTLSEPYGAMEWWPCKQSLTDKIDSIDIFVTTPEIYRTAGNGKLIAEQVNNGFRTMHWKHRFPIATYLVAIAVTNYAEYSDWLSLDDGRKIEILNFVYPENLENAKIETPKTAEMIALYNRLIGEYPFASEKYGHAQFGWSGGMEHQTMSFMYNFGFELVAHELAHQWFGDYITCGSWSDIWLNEGFATYLSGLAYENLLSDWWYRFKKVNVEKIVSQPGGSVYVTDTTNISTIFSGRLSYSKGAWILHMLRWTLGDDAFFKGMRSYFKDASVANGFANTNQFMKQMEAAGDTSLTEFFNDWFYGEGFPLYSANFKPAGNGMLSIELSQTQSHPSVGFFEMAVPVRVYSANRADSTDFRLVHTNNNQEFLVKVDFPVAELVIDPDFWLISKTSQVVKAQSEQNTGVFEVFPNPFSRQFSVIIPPSQRLLSVQLYNASGILVKQYSGDKTDFYYPEIPDGLYLVRITTNFEVFEAKIIKSNH